jgi:rhodanese-related sulfurtransferase
MLAVRLALSALILPLTLVGAPYGASAWAGDSEKEHAKAEFPDITKAELDQAIAAKTVTLIDCNGSGSYASGRIPGAIDFQAHKADLAAQLPAAKDALIVSYCGSPTCGAYKSGAMAAAALGYTNIRHYSDGISGWKAAGGTIER